MVAASWRLQDAGYGLVIVHPVAVAAEVVHVDILFAINVGLCISGMMRASVDPLVPD